ncbi:MAG: hypothetical protein NW701_20490 [Nitrospira sp.]
MPGLRLVDEAADFGGDGGRVNGDAGLAALDGGAGDGFSAISKPFASAEPPGTWVQPRLAQSLLGGQRPPTQN